ncbi:hypothetical protein B0J12DRAFT_432749 [Macrophomina phaseolina]|uniref:Uncharacterized protein n=1 Tax=Macrophomina phaseolina TaxID=35725 RepID=A0ABQ8GHA0_9PEZI|nr:hypothetical protein B0J12DRAFT_432749 [Macrophomina phaseolina]
MLSRPCAVCMTASKKSPLPVLRARTVVRTCTPLLSSELHRPPFCSPCQRKRKMKRSQRSARCAASLHRPKPRTVQLLGLLQPPPNTVPLVACVTVVTSRSKIKKATLASILPQRSCSLCRQHSLADTYSGERFIWGLSSALLHSASVSKSVECGVDSGPSASPTLLGVAGLGRGFADILFFSSSSLKLT